MKKANPKLAQLLELLARMFGGEALEARKLVDRENLFVGIAVPSNALKEGLDSAPEGQRAGLQTCAPLMKALTV